MTMKSKEIEELLAQLLEERGIPWVRQQGLVRFRLRHKGAGWELNCRCLDGLVECCARYPFSISNRAEALRRCNEINLQTARGTALLPPDGRPVIRTVAGIGDIYDAAERVERALDDASRLLLRFWGSLQQAGDNKPTVTSQANAWR